MFEALTALRRRHQLDVIEMPECGAEGLLVNYLTRVPTVVKFHSPARLIMPTYDVRRADHVLCSVIEQAAMFGASRFTSASRFLANEVHKIQTMPRKIAVIPNGIDLANFHPSETVGRPRWYPSGLRGGVLPAGVGRAASPSSNGRRITFDPALFCADALQEIPDRGRTARRGPEAAC